MGIIHGLIVFSAESVTKDLEEDGRTSLLLAMCQRLHRMRQTGWRCSALPLEGQRDLVSRFIMEKKWKPLHYLGFVVACLGSGGLTKKISYGDDWGYSIAYTG